MSRYLTKYEQETIVNFNRAEEIAYVFTYDKSWQRHMGKTLGVKATKDNGFGGRSYEVPKKWIRLPRAPNDYVVRPGSIGHDSRGIGEYNTLLLQPGNSSAGLVHNSPDQARISPPMAIVHGILKNLIPAVSDVSFPLHIAFYSKGGTVIDRRFKRHGQSWTTEGVNNLLKLRILWYSGIIRAPGMSSGQNSKAVG